MTASQVWARAAAAKKEALIKSAVERMMRQSISSSVRHCWSQWCRYVRRTLAETARKLKTALAADAQRIEGVRKENDRNVLRVMAAQRKAASELCLRQRWRNRVGLCFNLWIRWQTCRRREYADQRYQETEAALEHCKASTELQGYDAANLQHEISAMLALHEHTCKARIDARQISEAAVDRQVELDLAVVRQRYEAELAELTQTNQRLRKALLSSLAEAAGKSLCRAAAAAAAAAAATAATAAVAAAAAAAADDDDDPNAHFVMACISLLSTALGRFLCLTNVV
eukprot:COSAG02_NODE_6985_length_3247_cov_4.681385_2_plen_285_part_00